MEPQLELKRSTPKMQSHSDHGRTLCSLLSEGCPARAEAPPPRADSQTPHPPAASGDTASLIKAGRLHPGSGPGAPGVGGGGVGGGPACSRVPGVPGIYKLEGPG